jgi:RHS repeat-associated protein
VRDLVDNTATIHDHLDYDGYGNVTESSTGYGDRYKWTGREFDYATGLQYNRARYYDPIAGRWLNEDPTGFLAGDHNLFRYAGNQPTNETDPLGLKVKLVLRTANTPGTGSPIAGEYHITIVWYSDQGWVRYDGGGKGTKHPDHPDRPNYHRTPPAGKSPLPIAQTYQGGWDVVASPYATDEEELEKLDSAFAKLIQLPYNATGPNSNTYAHQLLTLAGFTVEDRYQTVAIPVCPDVGGGAVKATKPAEPPKDLSNTPLPNHSGFGVSYQSHGVGPTATTGWANRDSNGNPYYGGKEYDEYGNKRP